MDSEMSRLKSPLIYYKLYTKHLSTIVLHGNAYVQKQEKIRITFAAREGSSSFLK